MKFSEFKQENKLPEYEEARSIADSIYEYLCLPEVEKRIQAAHQFNAQSQDIQDVFLPKCTELGMTSDKQGVFADQITTRLRSDYFIPIGDSGLIMEVERDKTIANNMDLLDVWKCHLCNKADFLILIVPVIRQSGNGSNQKIYEHVINRVGTFFKQGNYVNINACFIIGYE